MALPYFIRRITLKLLDPTAMIEPSELTKAISKNLPTIATPLPYLG